MKSLQLTIVTPEQLAFEEAVVSLTVPGEEGYFQVLVDHAPLISTLCPGKLEWVDTSGTRHSYFVSGGIVEVSHNKISVLVDVIESAANIDMARAKRAYERARKRLAHHNAAFDLPRAQQAIHRASERIKMGKSSKSQ